VAAAVPFLAVFVLLESAQGTNRMRKRFRPTLIEALFLLLVLMRCAAVAYPILGQSTPNLDPALLPKILAETGAYCEKLKNMALNYTCTETISEKIAEFVIRIGRKFSMEGNGVDGFNDGLRVDKTVRNSFAYDYQMIKNGDVFTEKRYLLEENGRKTNEKDVPLKTMRVSVRYLVFGPVGFLSRAWQPHFNYVLSGRDKVDGQKAIILAASPAKPREENNCSGRIWVSESDFSILKIEWEPGSIPGFVDRAVSEAGTLSRKMTMTTVYGTVKNKFRFPSTQIIEERYILGPEKEYVKYRAEYRYDWFKYFTVETAIDVR
jgi:hypothetical protein